MLVENIDPDAAEHAIAVQADDNGCYAARKFVFPDGDEVIVLIYGAGPTPHISYVEAILDPPTRRKCGTVNP